MPIRQSKTSLLLYKSLQKFLQLNPPPSGPSVIIGSTIKIRRSCALRFKTVQSSWFRRLAWHPARGLWHRQECERKHKAASEAMQPGVQRNWNPQSGNSGFQLIRTNGEKKRPIFFIPLLLYVPKCHTFSLALRCFCRSQTYETLPNTIHWPIKCPACKRRKPYCTVSLHFICCCDLRDISFICCFNFQENREQAAVERSHLTN